MLLLRKLDLKLPCKLDPCPHYIYLRTKFRSTETLTHI